MEKVADFGEGWNIRAMAVSHRVIRLRV